MNFLSKHAWGLAVAATLALAPAVASAATISFGTTTGTGAYTESSFQFDSARRVTEGCGAGAAACLRLDQNDLTTMSYAEAGWTFNLLGLSFFLQHNSVSLLVDGFSIVADDDEITFTNSQYASGRWHHVLFDAGRFQNLTSVLFDNLNTANRSDRSVWIDNIIVEAFAPPPPVVQDPGNGTVAPVPLPAAGWLLLGGLGGLGWFGRRRNKLAD